jgi:hypothetical protein
MQQILKWNFIFLININLFSMESRKVNFIQNKDERIEDQIIEKRNYEDFKLINNKLVSWSKDIRDGLKFLKDQKDMDSIDTLENQLIDDFENKLVINLNELDFFSKEKMNSWKNDNTSYINNEINDEKKLYKIRKQLRYIWSEHSILWEIFGSQIMTLHKILDNKRNGVDLDINLKAPLNSDISPTKSDILIRLDIIFDNSWKSEPIESKEKFFKKELIELRNIYINSWNFQSMKSKQKLLKKILIKLLSDVKEMKKLFIKQKINNDQKTLMDNEWETKQRQVRKNIFILDSLNGAMAASIPSFSYYTTPLEVTHAMIENPLFNNENPDEDEYTTHQLALWIKNALLGYSKNIATFQKKNKFIIYNVKKKTTIMIINYDQAALRIMNMSIKKNDFSMFSILLRKNKIPTPLIPGKLSWE